MTGFLDIDLGAVAANWRKLAAMSAGETGAVLKADAYGLGGSRIAPVLAQAGCRTFFTAHLAEAVALRPLLPSARIVVLNGLIPHAAADFLAHDVTPALGSLQELAIWQAAARALDKKLPCFVHVETGMNRLAFGAAELAVLRDDPARLDGVLVEMVMSHLLSAELPDDEVNARQRADFLHHAALFPGAGKSLANSAGIFLGAAYQFDLTRPGAALYGLNPRPEGPNPMRDVVTFTAPILQIHDIRPGETVGYNGTWRATRPSRIATLGVGYADGYHRTLSNRATAYFDDTPVQLVGRVSMDLITFDVTDVPAKPGDLVTLLGPRHGADALAAQAGTNGYEILTSLGQRYQRRYLNT